MTDGIDGPDASRCPRCAAPLASGTKPEDCPRCLLAAGLESEPAAAAGATGDAAGAAADGGGAAPKPAPTAPSPEEIGRHFPQLEVLELLGQGGMGIVYKARQRSLERLVALKVMPPEAALAPGFAERFTREARTLARLQHANIVGVHDFGVADGLYYLLMEYVDGANLRQAMRDGKLTPAQALAVVPQVCDALQYAHEQGVVHRDIKPENILLDRAGRVRIADFGLAKIVQRTPVDVTLTRAGQVMGTVHYMAPEQYRTPDAVDHRADIYSLGVVFYEMLTGELPLGSFPPPSERAGVDARIDGVVLRALERERDRRWQHASDLKDRVSAITTGAGAAAAAGAGGAASSVGGGAAPPPPAPAPAPGPGVTAGEHGVRVVSSSGRTVEVTEAGVRIGGPGGAPFAAGVGGGAVPPTSRLAIAGGLGVPVSILAAVVAGGFAAVAGSEEAGQVGAIVGTAVLLAAWIASIAAWTQIAHAKGALGGKGWAVTGTFLPLLFLCCGGPFLVMGTIPGTGLIRVEDGPDGRRVRMPGIDVRESRRGGAEIAEVNGVARLDIDDVRPTAADEANAAFVTGGPAAFDEGEREETAGAARLLWEHAGARVLSKLGRAEPAPGFRVFHVALAAGGTQGRLVVTDGSVTLSLPVSLEDQDTLVLAVTDEDVEVRERAPVEDDRDGRLGE